MDSDTPRGMRAFIRRDLLDLGGYAAHKSPDTLREIPAGRIVKLDANENPYGASPGLHRAFASYKGWNVYPDAGQTRLREMLQGYTGIAAENIVAANGSGELLDEILRLLLEPGDEVINCLPTFDLYRFRTLVNRGKVVGVPRREDFGVDVPAVKAAITPRTKIIILSNPNNPTGNVTSRGDILQLVATGVPVLVDEAYYEFCGETVAPLVGRYPNLMVLRTLSKWAGLAGLRIGYGIVPREMASYLMRIKLPYNVNAAALLAIEQSLKDKDYLLDKVKAIVKERDQMFQYLASLPWIRPLASQANFIFGFLTRGNARQLWQSLQKMGILVRHFDQPRLENGVRFSVGKPAQTRALMAALRELEGAIDG